MHGRTLLWASMLLTLSCTPTGRVPQSQEQTDHPDVDMNQVWSMSDRNIRPGSFAPAVNLPQLFPGEITASMPKGEPYVLFFWASWCEDCQAEMPTIIRLQRSFPSLAWVTISLDSQAPEAQQYIRNHELRGIHLFDGRDWMGSACEDYAVPLHGIPYIIYIGKDGRILWCGGSADELQKALQHGT